MHIKHIRRWILSVIVIGIAGGGVFEAWSRTTQAAPQSKDWEIFEIDDLRARRARSGRAYLPFLQVPTLRMGLYVLPRGGTDSQTPHTLDETYYVVKGRATFRAGDDETPVKAGTVLFVRAGVEHRFHTITEDLEVLVFFSEAKE